MSREYLQIAREMLDNIIIPELAYQSEKTFILYKTDKDSKHGLDEEELEKFQEYCINKNLNISVKAKRLGPLGLFFYKHYWITVSKSGDEQHKE